MRLGKVIRYLNLWVKEGLITDDQSKKIADFMRLKRRQYLLRLIQVLFVMGAFWLVIGFFATIKLIDVKILLAFWNFICQIFSPLMSLAKWIAGEHYGYFLSGIGCIVGWGLFHYLGRRLQERSSQEMVKLGFLVDNDLRLGTTALTIGYVLASAAFQIFNYLIHPLYTSRYYGVREVVIPYFSFLAVVFFLYVAYRMKDQIALLFGIGFIGHAIGFLASYCFATYVVGVQMPGVQALVGVLLVFVGLWHVEKIRAREDQYFYLFGRTYQWTGLLFIYFSLWIMSIWGMTFQDDYWRNPSAIELWVANLLFLGASLGTLFYGAWKEDRLYFNFGLTFFIIDTYTLFFSRVWATVGTAIGSLLLGALLVGTGYFLRRLFLKKKVS